MSTTSLRFSLPRQLAWAATLACGFGLAWALAVVLIGTWAQEAWRGPNRPVYETVMVRSDGELLIRTYNLDNPSESAIQDIQGHPQEMPDADHLIGSVSLSGAPEKTGYFTPQPDWHSRLLMFTDEQEPHVNWFFVRDGKPDGAGYFVAYDQQTNRRIGSLGSAGFREAPLPAAEWIPVQGEPKSSVPYMYSYRRVWRERPERWDVPPHLVFLPSGRSLRRADLAARTVVDFLQTSEPVVSVGVPPIAAWSGGRHYATVPPILVRTAHEIQAVDQEGRVARKFAMPSEVDPRSQVAWYELGDGRAIAISDNHFVYRFGVDGGVQERLTLNLQSGSPVQNQTLQKAGLALACASPAVVTGISLLIELMTDPAQVDQSAALMLSRFWPWLIGVFAFSALLDVAAWRRCRAFGVSGGELASWTVFVFLLGLPAYVGFRLHRRWPVRLPCPNCHFRVPRDRDLCAECHTRFPDPGLKGIEVFA